MNCPENPHKKSKPGEVGWGGSFRGSKNQKSWNVMNCPENQLKKMLNPGGGWGGVEVLGVNIL